MLLIYNLNIHQTILIHLGYQIVVTSY